MLIASKGHFFTQIPHPMHNSSDKKASFEFGLTSIHSFPNFTTGQDLKQRYDGGSCKMMGLSGGIGVGVLGVLGCCGVVGVGGGAVRL
jgi:hypothetical protein